MRRRLAIPWLLMATLIGLTVGAAILGIASAPTLIYSLAPSGGSPSAGRELAQAARATMSLSNFTMNVGPSSAPITWQAPNRISDGGPFPMVTVGRITYYLARYPGTTWVEQPLPPHAPSARDTAMTFLRLLLRTSDIHRDADTFTGAVTAPAGNLDPSGLAVPVSVVIRDGDVVREQLAIPRFGMFGGKVVTVTYTKLGSSPPVVVPPAANAVPARRCGSAFLNPSVVCGQSGVNASAAR